MEHKEADFYKELKGRIQCELCPHNCKIAEGKVGICSIRKNIQGKLVALTYSRVSSSHLDPIEKKPLYYFHPGTTIFSIGGLGCNLGCYFCQNWEISQPKELFPLKDPEGIVEAMTEAMTPEQVVEAAKKYRVSHNSIGVAYTYNEPFIWYEYVLEVSKLIKENGLKNVLVTNGYVNEEPLKKLLPFIDALNIDIKSIKDKTYRKLKGSLDPVLETAKISKETCHVEITTLIVPTVNDRDDELVELFEWIADNLGKDTPLHLSRYFPVFKSDIPPTPVKTLQKAKKLALERLDRVSLGNI